MPIHRNEQGSRPIGFGKRSRHYRAFTLVEVLLAIAILGIGALALGAVFAGAVAQQQRASNINRSVAFAQNAAEIMASRITNMGGPSVVGRPWLTGTPSFTPGEYPGQWRRMQPARDDESNTLGFGDEAYALVEEDELIIFRVPAVTVSGPQARLDTSVVTRLTQQNFGGTHHTSFNNTGLYGDPLIADWFAVPPTGGFAPFTLPVGNLHPDERLIIEIDIYTYQEQGTNEAVVSFLQTLQFSILDPDLFERYGDAAEEDITRVTLQQGGDNLITLRLSGGTPGAGEITADPVNMDPNTLNGYIASGDISAWVSLDPAIVNPERIGVTPPLLASLEFAVPLSAPFGTPVGSGFFVGEFVGEVRLVRGVERRVHQAVSLNDRIDYVDDPGFPRGQRPSLAFTSLWRTLEGGGTQVAILTYALSPLDGAPGNPTSGGAPELEDDEFAFVPPERTLGGTAVQDDFRLFREEEVELRYDDRLEQFYLLADGNDDDVLPLLEPGNLVLIIWSDDPNVAGAGDGAGSDGALRITAQRPDLDSSGARAGRVRGYLDRGPRINGRSPLLNFSASENVRIIGFNQIVQSEGDMLEWRVRPVEVRIFQLGDAN